MKRVFKWVGLCLAGLTGWTEEQFAEAMRSGFTPYGKSLNAECMPWNVYSNMTDEEPWAIWRYVQWLNAEQTER